MAGKITDYLRSAEAFLIGFIESGVDAMRRAEGPFTLPRFVGMAVPDPGKKPTTDDRRLIRDVARRARGLINGLAAVDEQTLAVLLEAAKPLAAGCRERLLSDGFVSFDALLSLTRDVLAEHPAVRRDLGGRYPVLLVDEFQDTDPLQYEILFFIAGEEQDGVDDPWRLVPRPGTLFIVGDPKQSIYRFRGADFDAYRRAVEHLLSSNGEPLSLTASFRSPEGIIAPINRLFGSLMGRKGSVDPRFEPGYEEITAARGASTPDEKPRVEIWSVTGDGNAPARRRAEAAAIAGWIGARREESRDGTGVLACRDVALPAARPVQCRALCPGAASGRHPLRHRRGAGFL